MAIAENTCKTDKDESYNKSSGENAKKNILRKANRKEATWNTPERGGQIR